MIYRAKAEKRGNRYPYIVFFLQNPFAESKVLKGISDGSGLSCDGENNQRFYYVNGQIWNALYTNPGATGTGGSSNAWREAVSKLARQSFRDFSREASRYLGEGLTVKCYSLLARGRSYNLTVKDGKLELFE